MSMTRYMAQIDENNIVIQVIIATPEEAAVHEGTWIETWQGVGGTSLYRKNMASRGYVYDKERDAFYPPKPWDSWHLDEETCLWEPPIPHPTDKNVTWDESIKNWAPL